MTHVGRLTSLTTWPVKSLAGGVSSTRVAAGAVGLAGDRRYAVGDARTGRPLSARSAPGLLRWSAGWSGADPGEPLLTGPSGRQWSWSEPGLPEALTTDLGRPVHLLHDEAGCQDLERSVLVTTVATHEAVEQAFGRPLEVARWRTNLHLDGPLPPYAEHGWEGRRLLVGDVVLRLLHPCKRCTIPTWAPGGLVRTAELLRFFSTGDHAGPFGINARVEVPGTLERGAPVVLD